jgi:hypothetical protein
MHQTWTWRQPAGLLELCRSRCAGPTEISTIPADPFLDHEASYVGLYNAVHGSYLYRVSTVPGVVKHLGEIMSTAARVQKHVPGDDGGDYGRLMPKRFSYKAIRGSLGAARQVNTSHRSTYSGVPRRELVTMLVGLVRSQAPSHDPQHEKLPTSAAQWFPNQTTIRTSRRGGTRLVHFWNALATCCETRYRGQCLCLVAFRGSTLRTNVAGRPLRPQLAELARTPSSTFLPRSGSTLRQYSNTRDRTGSLTPFEMCPTMLCTSRSRALSSRTSRTMVPA